MPVTAQSMAVTAAKLKHELADLPLDHPNRPGLEQMARLECSPQARGCSAYKWPVLLTGIVFPAGAGMFSS
jgi:hypothetical protein